MSYRLKKMDFFNDRKIENSVWIFWKSTYTIHTNVMAYMIPLTDVGVTHIALELTLEKHLKTQEVV